MKRVIATGVQDLGGSVTVSVDEQIIYNQLDTNPDAVWSLLPGAGRLMPTVSR